MTRVRTIAVMLTPKKLGKFPMSTHSTATATVVILDPHHFSHQLDAFPVVDVLVHKLADFTAESCSLGRSLLGFQEAYKRDVERRVRAGQILRVLDGFEVMEMLQSRKEMLQAIEYILAATFAHDINTTNCGLSVPQWSTDLKSLPGRGLVIGKPMDACGSPDSHIMHLLQMPIASSLSLSWSSSDANHIYQRFLPHHQTLYKFYVIGESVDVVTRASVSADIFAKMNLFEYGVTVGKACIEDDEAALARLSVHRPQIEMFIDAFRRHYRLTLFGVDVIVGEEDGRAYIIDVNYFPGFDGVVDLQEKFSKAILI